MKRLKICVVTGTRAEFGIFRPVLAAIAGAHTLQLQLLVTGMHLRREFGGTVRDIVASDHTIAARVEMYRSGEPAAASLARGTAGMAKAFRRLRPDIVMVLGDRLEMLAAGNAALAERIPLAHVHGGESAPGIWDEQIRHALTKMSHLHFCATRTALRRLLRMGEDPESIHQVGAPALDFACAKAKEFRGFLGQEHLKSLRHQFPVLLLHPSSPDAAAERLRALSVIGAVREVFPKALIRTIWPNNDPGHTGILAAYAQERKHLLQCKSIEQDVFWVALMISGVLVGNSSSGIIEAATFGCAVVNVGDRQAGRERSGNVIDVPWSSGSTGIAKALRRALREPAFTRRVAERKNIYGDGHASQRIVDVLEKVARRGISPVKRFCD